MPLPGLAAYAMSKSACRGLARGSGAGIRSRGITVNVVQRVPIDTEMNPADGPMKS